MRNETITIYEFDELNDEQKQKAIDGLHDINTDYEWWDCTYEDAKTIGLNIIEFDIYRASYVKADFIGSARETAEKILKEHGEKCETFIDATNLIEELDKAVDEAEKDENNCFVDECELDLKMDELESEFLKTVQENYRIMLQKEFEYQTSEEAIIESIRSNEYEFYSDGRLVG